MASTKHDPSAGGRVRDAAPLAGFAVGPVAGLMLASRFDGALPGAPGLVAAVVTATVVVVGLLVLAFER